MPILLVQVSVFLQINICISVCMYIIYMYIYYIYLYIHLIEPKDSLGPLYIDYGVVVPWSSGTKSQYNWALKKEALQNIC